MNTFEQPDLLLQTEFLLDSGLFIYQVTLIVGLLSVLIAKIYLPKFLEYGKTYKGIENKSNNQTIINILANITVPKSYFAHFYIISTFLATINLINYPAYHITWLLLIHSVRRLYETLYVSKFTIKSRMNISHYLVGLWFYISLNFLTFYQLHYYYNIFKNNINFLTILIFTLSSINQYRNHLYLSTLVKYTLPKKGLFKYIISPHYLNEILIYLSLALSSNIYFMPLIWVTINLSISSIETKNYYTKKFKDENVPTSNLVPHLF